MKPAIIVAMLIFLFAQICAWFQSNSGIIGGWLEENYVYTALLCGPIVALSFAYGTKLMYGADVSLWSIRFITFGLGYMIFIPLTWYFLGEEIITVKNIVSLCLCVTLMLVQAYL